MRDSSLEVFFVQNIEKNPDKKRISVLRIVILCGFMWFYGFENDMKIGTFRAEEDREIIIFLCV